MVIPDLSAPISSSKNDNKPAAALDRFLGGIFDILLLVPIATFVPAFHIHEARADYLQGFESTIWYQIVLLWILAFVAVQTLFLYFTGTTPGGLIMHTRVRSMTGVSDFGGKSFSVGALTWNQCLLRSVFSLFSWVFLGLPYLEVMTHPLRRAWHDRVSDTLVVDLKQKSLFGKLQFNVAAVRVFMTVGIFMIMMVLFSFVQGYDQVLLTGEARSEDTTDALIAQALLKKDFSEDTQMEIEERIWSSGKSWEKALSYFFKMNIEKDQEMKKALADQICKWSPSDKAGSLCSLAQYVLKNDAKTLQVLAQASFDQQTLTSKVFLMKELTKNSQYASAMRIYKQVKKQYANQGVQDSLKIWDVSLFWALRESQLKSKRIPASEGSVQALGDNTNEALADYVKERSEP